MSTTKEPSLDSALKDLEGPLVEQMESFDHRIELMDQQIEALREEKRGLADERRRAEKIVKMLRGEPLTPPSKKKGARKPGASVDYGVSEEAIAAVYEAAKKMDGEFTARAVNEAMGRANGGLSRTRQAIMVLRERDLVRFSSHRWPDDKPETGGRKADHFTVMGGS